MNNGTWNVVKTSNTWERRVQALHDFLKHYSYRPPHSIMYIFMGMIKTHPWSISHPGQWQGTHGSHFEGELEYKEKKK